ncbi:uncharacterized protein MELLADRAFT_94317 [Melampsora larici-populina 98AG31]|uniref:Uncharacterized protein n=1 Tax=Melampsora larici-populina (strain 98AG31 / pathotype 3-4-7) TaxID=747676 RepID=F4S7A3_MELLP|nr:uncharacterized protein MELLADRAFT_94317 [Melampsora larici-populina 98AG31]EGF99481.1 hypothetical protein MELLADRAFT_94317 [Melampsora larici-populina 98AG31]
MLKTVKALGDCCSGVLVIHEGDFVFWVSKSSSSFDVDFVAFETEREKSGTGMSDASVSGNRGVAGTSCSHGSTQLHFLLVERVCDGGPPLIAALDVGVWRIYGEISSTLLASICCGYLGLSLGAKLQTGSFVWYGGRAFFGWVLPLTRTFLWFSTNRLKKEGPSQDIDVEEGVEGMDVAPAASAKPVPFWIVPTGFPAGILLETDDVKGGGRRHGYSSSSLGRAGERGGGDVGRVGGRDGRGERFTWDGWSVVGWSTICCYLPSGRLSNSASTLSSSPVYQKDISVLPARSLFVPFGSEVDCWRLLRRGCRRLRFDLVRVVDRSCRRYCQVASPWYGSLTDF